MAICIISGNANIDAITLSSKFKEFVNQEKILKNGILEHCKNGIFDIWENIHVTYLRKRL